VALCCFRTKQINLRKNKFKKILSVESGFLTLAVFPLAFRAPAPHRMWLPIPAAGTLSRKTTLRQIGEESKNILLNQLITPQAAPPEQVEIRSNFNQIHLKYRSKQTQILFLFYAYAILI
jgi:hypothetical protein